MAKLGMVAAFGLGAGMMYYFDPVSKNRRRAILRDKAVHLIHEGRGALDVSARDLAHRAYGLGAQLKSNLAEHEVADEILVERVRSKMGRVVSHPHAIHVQASEGRVKLDGLVLQDELDDLLAAISSVRGVKSIDNNLMAHESARNIAALQGGKQRPGIRPELMQHNWAPATRALMGGLGLGLAAYGLSSRQPFAKVGGGIGLIFLLRALTNTDARNLLGLGEKREIRVHKTINVGAPTTQVFDFWSDFTNLPKFMPDIKSVSVVSNDVYRWTIRGPAGVPVHFDARVTQFIPNELITWESEPGAVVSNRGRVRFTPNPDDSTRLDLDVSYVPPAGALGHIVAKIFGTDPKSKLDDDLMRVKGHFEAASPEAAPQTTI